MLFRSEFIGYDTQRVRYLVLIISGFFAGISGALAAINFEIVSSENVSAIRSGTVLLFTFIGGVPFFFGPMIGAVIFGFFIVVLATITKAWLLYLGLFFVMMVMYCPGGIATLIMMQFPIIKSGRFKEIFPSYCVAASAGLVLLLALVFAVEMIYHLSLEAAAGTNKAMFGMNIDVASAPPWIGVALLTVIGAALFVAAKRGVTTHWNRIMGDIIKAQTI